MKEELKQMLLNDYASRGLPYQRGYLLYSRPGTRKLSLSISIASCFGLNVYVVSLTSINDSQLNALFAELPQRYIILLKDVDAAGTTQVRDANNNQLLNVLNSVASQDRRILIITTNHIKHLDDALIQPSCINIKIKFKLTNAKVIQKLFCTIFKYSEEEVPSAETQDKKNADVQQLAVKFTRVVGELEHSPADILSFLFSNRGYVSKALADVEG
ncbi:unnamed protein product [Colletotrichum noveboracense]|uniref:ATPase AAA-type core domain-containing protein n=1 Tax=Colletotrichum noveboracense TaxID=2664923 RepID=A0A9W4S4Z5_9PEZI|nr:unnamed protein product [Colletotrichum noveboracense]